MQTINAQTIADAGKNAAADFSAAATTAFAGFEKLAELNMATAKSVLTGTLDSLQAVAAAKTPEEVLAAQTNLVKPLTEKATAYSRSVYEIASATSTELSKSSKEKIAEAQKTFNSSIESLTKNAPAGSEAFVAALKNAAATGQQVLDSAQAAAKQAMSQAEAHVTDVVAKTVKSTAKA